MILLCLGLPPCFVDLIMISVTSVSYSYMLNGSQFGRLVPERGSSPRRPFVMEAFLGLIARAEAVGLVHGVKVAPSAPSISVLYFADDTMVFCRATREDAIALKSILDRYAVVSGQVINFDKSSMTFSSNVHPGLKDQIAQILGVQVVAQHDRYLGMPVIVGKSKQQIFGVLRDRVKRRINGWGEKLLS